MKFVRVIFMSLLVFILSGMAQQTPQQKYISRYASTAVREMYRSGVPASITLAQGLLESRSGLSPLASKGNNHFGIKCHDWKGKHMNFDDDAKGECFRVYDSADESFRDHSDFLRYRDRYKFLFEFKTTDYKAWARGLKKAGYATDPAYADKLIKIIEDYDLSKYDKMKPSDFKDVEVAQAEPQKEEINNSREKKSKKEAKKESKKAKKSKKKDTPPSKSLPEQPEVIPQSPLEIEEAKPFTPTYSEEFQFSLSRKMYSKNGVPFVYASEGETYSSIASANKLFLKELLKYNDLKQEEPLTPGTIVYLQPKKTHAQPGLDKYIVGSDSENLRDICQRFAVKQSSIEKMNGFTSDYQPKLDDTILLRDDPFLKRMLRRKNK